jgi:RNA-binding protein YhbY
MGSLLDDIKNETRKTGTKPRIVEVLEQLDKQDRQDFIAAINDTSIPASNIARAMTKRGIKVTGNMITRYRRGEQEIKFNEPR